MLTLGWVRLFKQERKDLVEEKIRILKERNYTPLLTKLNDPQNLLTLIWIQLLLVVQKNLVQLYPQQWHWDKELLLPQQDAPFLMF